MIYIFAFLLFVSSSLSAYTVGIIGDSISMPSPVSKEEGWPYLLEKRYNWHVINCSVGASTTDSLMTRLVDLHDGHAPDMVIITLGICDALYGYPMDRTRQNLQKAISYCIKNNIQVLMGIVDISYLGWHCEDYGIEYSKNFRQVYYTLKTSFKGKLKLFPFMTYDIESNYCFEDHFHPNASGHAIIAEEISKMESIWISK